MGDILPIKLSDLTREIREVIKHSFDDTYWIIAEVSGHKFYPNNDRHYFELIEKEEGANEPIAKVSGRAWREGSETIKIFEDATGQVFTTGLQVLIKVKLEFHPAHGFALILLDIDQSFTLGNLEKQRRLTLQKLLEENPDAIEKIGEEYITRNKKTKLPAVIQHIAIIGSPNSEGYIDFTHTLQNNQYSYTFNIDIYQSSVQGQFAEKELVTKLIDVHQSEIKYDAVVMIRGGGAKTDFLVFDTYQLARAAARFPIPIITGIGHHKDVSIVDMMVNTSVKTPTKAAEFIIAHNRKFEERVSVLQRNIIIRTQQLLKENFEEINQLHSGLINNTRSLLEENKENLGEVRYVLTNKTVELINDSHQNLQRIVSNIRSGSKIGLAKKDQVLTNIKDIIKTGAIRTLKNKNNTLAHHQALIKLIDPKNLLKKGFAIIRKDEKIIIEGKSVTKGETLSIEMYDNIIITEVKSIKTHEGH